jgi:OOP family OmpA-OmpF porin
VSSRYSESLKKVAEYLKAHPENVAKLTAYSDNRNGTVAYNKRVSERRAKAVARSLMAKGVPEAQINMDAMGGTDAFNSESGDVKGNRLVICRIE